MEYDAFIERYGDKKQKPWAGALGVYIVSPKCPTGFENEGGYKEECGNNVPKNVKIGKATGRGGFKTRFKTYYTYWPQGLMVHGLLVTPSFDQRWFTYKDHATKRETTLKRVLTKKNLIGFGPANGTERLGSEWVRGTPAKIMPFLNSVAKGNDVLYGCTREACRPVSRRAHVTRQHAVLQELVDELRPPESANSRTGGRGKPRVMTRQTTKAARPRAADPIKPRANALVAALDRELGSAKARIAACPRRSGHMLKAYPATSTRAAYAHQDVSGDGNCYFYAVLRALGLPLTAGGRTSDALDALSYFDDERTRRKWKRMLERGTWADPVDVLLDSIKMRRHLWSRGIRYVVKLERSRPGPSDIDAFMRSPLAAIRGRANNSVFVLTATELLYSEALSKQTPAVPEASAAFKAAHSDGRIVGFVWRNVVDEPAHYELIVPTRLSTVLPRAMLEITNTSGFKHKNRTNSVRRSVRRHSAAKSAEPNDKMRNDNSVMRRLHPNHRYHADLMTDAGIRYRKKGYFESPVSQSRSSRVETITQ